MRLVGDTVAFAALPDEPLPARATVCGLFPAASLKVRVAVREPVAVGLNVILTVQLADPARLAPQVLVAIAKSPAFAPERTTLVMAMAVVPPLVSVTD